LARHSNVCCGAGAAWFSRAHRLLSSGPPRCQAGAGVSVERVILKLRGASIYVAISRLARQTAPSQFDSRRSVSHIPKVGTLPVWIVPLNGVAFTGEGNLVRRRLSTNRTKLKPRYPTSGSPAARAELPAPHWTVSVTHRFLRRGF